MSEDKLLGLQMQVRQNQQELLEEMKELEAWQDEMKRKEQRLRTDQTGKPDAVGVIRFLRSIPRVPTQPGNQGKVRELKSGQGKSGNFQ